MNTAFFQLSVTSLLCIMHSQMQIFLVFLFVDIDIILLHYIFARDLPFTFLPGFQIIVSHTLL